jgi:hypothetical protein
MPIDVTCGCGHKATVSEAFAGKKARCPACGAVLGIPLPVYEPDEELSAILRASASILPAPAPPPIVSPDPKDAPAAPTPAATTPAPDVQRVVVVGANIPFGSMCWLVFRWTMATIPTVVVLGGIGFLLWLLVRASMR